MGDWDSASYAAMQVSMERTRAQCRCKAERDDDCECADYYRDKQRDDDMEYHDERT